MCRYLAMECGGGVLQCYCPGGRQREGHGRALVQRLFLSRQGLCLFSTGVLLRIVYLVSLEEQANQLTAVYLLSAFSVPSTGWDTFVGHKTAPRMELTTIWEIWAVINSFTLQGFFLFVCMFACLFSDFYFLFSSLCIISHDSPTNKSTWKS